MINIHKFITEDDVNYYKSKTNDEIKKMFENDKKHFNNRELYGLPDGNLDVLLEQFRENDFTKYCRENNWRHSFTKVLNNDGKINRYRTWLASFKYINKWNQESESQEYTIITDSNMKILWVGINNEYYFISVGKNIYGFKYEYKQIALFPNISSADEYFSEEDIASNDQLIIKYKENMRLRGFVSFDNAKYIFKEEKIGVIISIAEYFEKGFFYKGIKWNKNYEYMYPKDITILVSIQARENLFYIEFENITYPYYGYILLDLYEFRIIEAKKIENHFEVNMSEKSFKEALQESKNTNADHFRYMNELDEKVKKAREVCDDVPRIGIFWLCLKDGKIEIFYSEPITLEFGQEYSSFIVAPREHYNTWESLKRHKIIPWNSNYEDLPRGRVAYNKSTNQYVVYHGNYIKSSPDIKSVIKSEFNLRSRIRWVPDLHYHKFKRWGF